MEPRFLHFATGAGAPSIVMALSLVSPSVLLCYVLASKNFLILLLLFLQKTKIQRGLPTSLPSCTYYL